MSSPLAMILTQNKLMGENYVDWKRNLDIVLTAENHKMVLTKFYLIKNSPNSILLSRLKNQTRRKMRFIRPGCSLTRMRDAIS